MYFILYLLFMLDFSSIKYENALHDWYEPTSLLELSERLSKHDPADIESARRLIANWVVKYFNGFYFPQNIFLGNRW